MKSILIIAIVVAGLGFLVVLFKLLKKAGKFALKLPTNFLLVFLIYAVLGLSGFLLNDTLASRPILLGTLVLLVSLTVGIVFANNLYYRWEWSQEATFGRKLLYLMGIALTAMVAFALSFLLSEHRGWPGPGLFSDLAPWLSGLVLILILPSVIVWLHAYWNEIPKISSLKHIFQLPVDGTPPFIETGGASLHFQFIIPLDYRSKDLWRSKVAVPFNKTLAEVFHYKLHEHNVVKRFVKKIVFAEDNQRSKVYGWCFYRLKKIWWGWWSKKIYLNPQHQVGKIITHNESIFVERVKTWEQD